MLRRFAGPATLAAAYSDKVLSYSPIAYWPLWEAEGSVAECLVDSNQNGAYTGVTLGEEGIGDGRACPLFDGLNDHIDIYSTTFRDAFDGDEGSVIVWVKVYDSGVWIDSAQRYLVFLRASGNDYLRMLKGSGGDDDSLLWRHVAATQASNSSRTDMTELGWFVTGFTWSYSADEAKAYYNGIQQGATNTGLKNWLAALSTANTRIGSYNATPTYPWHGYLAHCAVWDTPLAPATMLDLATV